MKRRTLAGLTAIGLLASLSTYAQEAFPSRIRIVTAFSAGSGPDAMLRVIADNLSTAWKTPVIVDNKPGGSGFIAITEAKRSAPDGATLLHIEGMNVTAVPHMYAKLPYSAKRDLLPITSLHGNYFYVAVPADSRYQTAGQLISAAKAAPNKVSFGSWQIGSIAHLGGEMLSDRAGVAMLHVPYKENSALYTSLARGDIDWAFASIASAGNLQKAGKLRFIAVAGPQRDIAHPEVPTVAESGGPAGFEASSWVGLFAPAGTPAPLIARMNADINKVLQSDAIASRMKDVGYTSMGSSVAAMNALIDRQGDELGKAVKKINLTLD
ncbi:tripartite tricarboxylate transporter substrate binding protein [uncultured Xylophilus sp.]|uniref:Bug family tripartite tricarboxylate transporter substrate binding protein n=1 Tax=uncultured Xylophilus sp. TaxID=296832 RepID=UPI0025E43BD3|nr:tripartite tricarboxylate transporter substrate binding protein [uncultured Xylophilus sp.]